MDGCEAISDIRQAKILGAKSIIVPMIESSFAMKKFISAIRNVYDENELEDVEIGVNIESITGIENIEKILNEKEVNKYVKRVIIGRKDLISSMGLQIDEVNSDIIFNDVKKVFEIAKIHNFKTSIGGLMDIQSIPFIKKLGNLLDYYETRNIIFKNDDKDTEGILKRIVNAQRFELNYLEDLANRYNSIVLNNIKRCEVIKQRIIKTEKYLENKKD